MDYKEIQELIKLVKKNNISELEIERKDFKISIRSQNEHAATEAPVVYAQPQVHQQPAIAVAPQPQAPTQEVTVTTTVTEAVDSKLVEIKSPMIGTFYRAPGPDKDPYVGIGDTIAPGQVICMIEAMKLFNEIESEYSGKIVKILVEDATPVEYDQPLFLIDPTA